ncbi:GH16 beta-1 3-glucan recognition protein [Mycena sanguinolenta]|uniref:GH16 beta-1 3-glucan recognition protein n=1 Tax=Mycena sanguinolenta TaxID=230812 RepID=A0A8H7DHS4_9AGAR|nr:GH16 beta-1 3-glucan recognition protein [Mycena sanguinolenta]
MARKNPPSYPKQGINYVHSSLDWDHDVSARGGEDWDEESIRMCVDSRLDMYETKLSRSFWDRGNSPSVMQNETESIVLENPWVDGTKAPPFDQSFDLIMSLAVSGTNLWLPDGLEKLWLDGSLPRATS